MAALPGVTLSPATGACAHNRSAASWAVTFVEDQCAIGGARVLHFVKVMDDARMMHTDTAAASHETASSS